MIVKFCIQPPWSHIQTALDWTQYIIIPRDGIFLKTSTPCFVNRPNAVFVLSIVGNVDNEGIENIKVTL